MGMSGSELEAGPQGSQGGSGGPGITVGGASDDLFVQLGLIDPKSVDPGGTWDQGQGQAQDVQDAEPDWEDDSNPYKNEVKELKQRIESTGFDGKPEVSLEQQRALIEREAAAMLQQFMSGPVAQNQMHPQVAQALVNMAKENALMKAEHEAERQTLMPAAKREVAERIAKEFTTKKVKVDSKDLMSEPTVEAMRTRAKLTAEMQRDGTFNARKQSGADRAEGATGGRHIDENTLSQMSPEMKIRLGLKLGHK